MPSKQRGAGEPSGVGGCGARCPPRPRPSVMLANGLAGLRTISCHLLVPAVLIPTHLRPEPRATDSPGGLQPALDPPRQVWGGATGLHC